MENQQETTTYGELKCLKAEIRNEMDEGDFRRIEEYTSILKAIKRAEAWLLWGIVCLILFVAIQGCQTAKGIAGDSGWLLTKLSQNIQTEK